MDSSSYCTETGGVMASLEIEARDRAYEQWLYELYRVGALDILPDAR